MSSVQVPDASEVPPSLSEQIYASLRQEIVEGQLRPGHRLVELTIAKRFGVSQAPVREALRRLSQEGLAVNEPRRGTRIRQLTLREIEEIYEVRAELEAYAARRFVTASSAASAKALKRAYSGLARASRSANQAAMLEQDVALHQSIVLGAQSTVLHETWLGVIGRWRGMRAIVASQWPQDPAGHLASHDPIVENLLAGDSEAAERCVRTHLEQAFTELSAYLTAVDPEDRVYVEQR
ncbi:GntR family transcriptional regulator [Streptomyces olivaceus]